MLSHGTGGSELGNTSLTQVLAQNGYRVAALRHAGDYWQDQSLLAQEGGIRYFSERPKQVLQVVDAILSDEFWRIKIAGDARGFKVGVIGNSAGGYAVIALAGGQIDVLKIRAHCETNRTADSISCCRSSSAGLAPNNTSSNTSANASGAIPPLS